MNPVVWVHIAGGAIALAAGFSAAFLRKGTPAHQAAGTVFAVSMLVMCGTALVMSLETPVPVNILAASLTAYLVATGWMTVRPRTRWIMRAEPVLAVLGLGVVAMAGFFALSELMRDRASGSLWATALPFHLVFGLAAVLAALGDMAAIRAGGLGGWRRLARHLWRMLLALTIAALSFFIGQADEFPEAWRGPHLAGPPLLALGLLVVWAVRVRFSPYAAPPASPVWAKVQAAWDRRKGAIP